MNPTALAAWIVNYQALAAAVLLVALLAGLLVRQPVQRAALDWATLAGLLALAVLSALPGWPRVALFERPAVVQAANAAPPVVNVPPREAPVIVRQAPPRNFRPRFEPMRQQPTPAVASSRPPVSAPAVDPAPKPAPWQWSDLAAPLAYGYAAGIAFVAAWLLWGAIESWRLVRRGTLPADDLLAALAGLVQGKPPRLLVSRDVSAAAALGALRPTILVTPQLAAAPAEVVRAVLAHELAHLRHGDLWFLALGRAGLLLLYPQPCYWWLRRRAADTREALADAAAAGPSERTQYAELLVAAARTLSGSPRRGPALAILERPSQLGRRVKLLLDPRGAIELRSSRRWKWLGAAAAAAVVLAASLVQVTPAAVGQSDEQAASPDEQGKATKAEYKRPETPRQDTAPTYAPVEPDAAGGLTYRGLVVDSKTGKPVEGATVFVARLVSSGEDYKLLETSEHRSDRDGKYQITIPREQAEMRRLFLTVDAEHPQYAKRTLGGYGLSLIRRNEQFGSPPFYSRIELLPGVEVTGSIEDPQGKPVPNLSVHYFSVDPDGGDPLFTNSRSQGSVRTDANGRFKFNALRGGESTLWVAPSSAIAPGNLASKTMYLGKRTGDVGPIRLEPGQQLTGRVLDAEGAPLPSVWVHASSLEPVFLGSAEGRRDQRDAQTNERGEFSLDALPPGKYQVSVANRNWGARFGDQTITPLRAVFKRQVVEVADKAGAPLEFKAVPQFTLEAQWVDSSGQPTAGHSAMVTGKWNGEHFAAEGLCDDKGQVVAVIPRGMTEVQFQPITSEHSSLRMRRGKDGPLLDETNLDLGTPTGDVRDLYLVRYQAPIVVVRARDAAGRPIKDFRPRIDFRNPALRSDPKSRWASGVDGDVLLEQAPDESWRTVQLRPDEEMTVRVAAPGFREASRDLKLPEGQTESVEFVLEPLAPGEAESKDAQARPQAPAAYSTYRVYRPVEPDATGALTYRAHVVDHETGMPVEGATVVVTRLDPFTGVRRKASKSESTTNDVGEFSFTLSPAELAEPRLYLEFVVEHPDYVQQRFGGELGLTRARERVGLPPEFRKLELNAGEPIFGQVVTPDGQPLAGLEVRYLTMSSEAHGSVEGTRVDAKTVTDAEGRFRFNAVRGGLTRLWVEPADYAPRTLLLGKRTGDLGRIELQAGKQLTGTLLDVEGRPVPNAWVKVGAKTYPFVKRMSGEQGQRVAQTDAHGRFTLGPLLPGEYQASVSGRNWNNHELHLPESPLPAVFLAQLVTVGQDAPTTDVTLRATPHVRVEATLVDGQGAPVGDAAFDAFLMGKVSDAMVGLETYRDRPGHISILAPRGLREARLDLGVNRAGTVSYRRGPAGQLIEDRTVNLGTLDQDVTDIQVVHTPSPTLIVQAVDSDGRTVDYARPRIDYPRGTRNVPSDQPWPSGVAGQAPLSLQADGRWRSEGLLPDQDFTLTMELPSGQTASRAFKLQAGETKEATIVVPEMLPYLVVADSSHKEEPEPAEEGGFRLVWDEGPMEEKPAAGEEKPQEGEKKDSEAPDADQPDSSASEPLYKASLPLLPLPQLTEEEKASAKPDTRKWVYQGSTPVPLDHESGKPPRSIAQPGEPQPEIFTTFEPTPASTKVTGIVTDEHGQPLPGVKVDAWHWHEGNETITDAQGRYELNGFEPNQPLELVFSKDGLSPLLRTDVEAGTVCDVKLDDRTAIAGTIRDAAGQPVKDAIVRASYVSTVGDWFIVPYELQTTTDADGRYRLLVSRGVCDLWARKPGVGLAQRAFVMPKPGDAAAIDLQLEPGVRFEARLQDSVTGRPVAGAKLKSQFADVTGTSDVNGLVVLDALPQVQLAFDVEAPGYARWWSRQSSIRSDHENPERAGQWQDDTGHLRFELFSDRVSAEIELEPAVVVRGRVVDPNGAPVGGAMLAASIVGQDDSVSDNRHATTADGRFEIHLPASGDVQYNLVAHDGPWRESRNWANGYGAPLRTTPGQTIDGLELRLTRGATIRGLVVDQQGQPVAGKQVVAKANHARANRHLGPRATTDAEGRFELRNVESGSNTIMLDEYRLHEEASPGSARQIEVKPGEDQQDLRLIAEPNETVVEAPFFRTYPAKPESEEESRYRRAEAFRPDAWPSGNSNYRLLWDVDVKPAKKD